MKTKQHRVLILSMVLVCAAVMIKSLTIWLKMENETNLGVAGAVRFGISLSLIVCLPGLLIYRMFFWWGNSKFLQIYTTAIATVSLYLVLQGFVFDWSYGDFDGSPINFEIFNRNGLIEIATFTILVSALFKFRHLVADVMRVATILGFVFMITILIQEFYKKESVLPWAEDFDLKSDMFYTFSKERNVIFLTLDGTRGDLFEEVLGLVEPKKLSSLNGFIWYPNYSSSFNVTTAAIPSLLTGWVDDYRRTPDRTRLELKRQFFSNESLLVRVKSEGWSAEVYPYAAESVYLNPSLVSNLSPKQKVLKSSSISEDKLLQYIYFSLLHIS